MAIAHFRYEIDPLDGKAHVYRLSDRVFELAWRFFKPVAHEVSQREKRLQKGVVRLHRQEETAAAAKATLATAHRQRTHRLGHC